MASNPEFLREGSALYDTFYPDRVVIGANQSFAINALRELYTPLLEQSFPHPISNSRPQQPKLPVFLTTTPTSAELIKYASNAFLAMKVSFINEFAGLAEHVGADITEVARGIGLDDRIGMRYQMPGAGWGGSCFGKDVSAILHTAQQYNHDMHLVDATIRVNQRQHESIVRPRLYRWWSVAPPSVYWAFPSNPTPMKCAPPLTIAARPIDLGANVKAHDPVAIPTVNEKHPDLAVTYCESAAGLAQDCDAVALPQQG